MVRASTQAIRLDAIMTVMLLCDSVVVKTTRERSAGKPHAAFDEGDLGEPWSLLYRPIPIA